MILILLLSSADFFFKINYFKASFRNMFRVSNSLYIDQGRRSTGTHARIQKVLSEGGGGGGSNHDNVFFCMFEGVKFNRRGKIQILL